MARRGFVFGPVQYFLHVTSVERSGLSYANDDAKEQNFLHCNTKYGILRRREIQTLMVV